MSILSELQTIPINDGISYVDDNGYCAFGAFYTILGVPRYYLETINIGKSEKIGDAYNYLYNNYPNVLAELRIIENLLFDANYLFGDLTSAKEKVRQRLISLFKGLGAT